MQQYLFVYGTLRRGAGHPMHRVLRQYSRYAGLARYAGRLYDVGGYPAVVPRPGAPAAVRGELYCLLQPALLLPLLDRYEGCTERDGARAEYTRAVQLVQRRSGSAVHAWVYLYNRPLQRLTPIASGDYLSRQARRHGRSADTTR
jgi:gamma-glutamylcyclotransferase (GGCT)/AIG2-like uncharacterized protein YtfP